MVLLFLESLGTTELLVILVVALVLFGPRKLPEITRSFGKSLSEFKRASDDFKRTWEREVALESVQREAAIERAMVAEPELARISPDERGEAAAGSARDITVAAAAPVQGVSVARGAAHVEPAAPVTAASDANEEAPAEQFSRKTDWL